MALRTLFEHDRKRIGLRESSAERKPAAGRIVRVLLARGNNSGGRTAKARFESGDGAPLG
jgi:hypothetical protein